jgi:hypothetical protein
VSAKKPIPLSELILSLEADSDHCDFRGLIDLQEGEYVMVDPAAFDDPEEWLERTREDGMMDSDDPEFLIAKAVADDRGHERFILPPDKYEYHEYEKMSEFIEELTDDHAADQLRQAIRGKGAFRYFKDTVRRLNLLDAWYAYREKTMKEFVIAWAEELQVPYIEDK